MSRQFSLRSLILLLTFLAIVFSLFLRSQKNRFVYSSVSEAIDKVGKYDPVMVLPPIWKKCSTDFSNAKYRLGTMYSVPVDKAGKGTMMLEGRDQQGRKYQREIDESCYAIEILGTDGSRFVAVFRK